MTTTWACPVCRGRPSVLYGMPGLERCINCWIADPGYDRPDSDPYIVRLREWAAATDNHDD